MSSLYTLVRDYAAGRPFRKSLSSRTAYGALRVSYDEQYFYSYAMKLAYRDPDGNIIINGEAGPSNTTRKHQRALRSGLVGAQIPFSVLDNLGIPVMALRVIESGPDFTLPRRVRCTQLVPSACFRVGHEVIDGKIFHQVEDHFLGETLFEYKGDLYLCGLDRNEPPRTRHFYVARLPQGCTARTVEEGLKALRPAHVPETALRQGEWFFVPTAHTTAGKLAKELHLTGPLRDHVTKKVPLDGRDGRHVVSEMLQVPGRVFVRGVVRDQEHTTLKLPNTWYEVFRNLSRGGFSINANNRVSID